MYYIAKPLSARFSHLAVDPCSAQGNRGLDRGTHGWTNVATAPQAVTGYTKGGAPLDAPPSELGLSPD